MGIVQVTTRPSYYAALEAEAEKNAPEPEIVLTGKMSVKLEVCGMKSRNAREIFGSTAPFALRTTFWIIILIKHSGKR